MLKALAPRILATVPTVIGVTVIVFLVVHLLPGDPARAMLGDSATPEQVEALRKNLGLTQPLAIQFWEFIKNYATGDFGVSLATRQPVIEEIAVRLGPTLALATAGVIVSVLLGVPLGVFAATRRGTLGDNASQFLSTLGVATPPFWLALLLLLVFAVDLGWFPSIGPGNPESLSSMLHALVLPGFALGLPGMALVARMTRSSMLEILDEDYVRTARAKGLRERVVLYKHALRNAAIPILTIVGLSFGNLLGGTIVIEVVFARPGLGKLLLDAILYRDYPVVQGVAFVIAFGFVIVNLVTDVMYVYLDPRMRNG